MDSTEDIDDENSTELCLVCSKVVESNENDKLLDKNLLVIFLLKNVLQVSNDQLEENLKLNGNPFEWIKLCEECSQLCSQALKLHCQIIKFDRELWLVQKLIVEKTKSSNSSLSTTANQSVWKRTRQFVMLTKSNFQSGDLPVNLFIEGDKLAAANYFLRWDLNVNSQDNQSTQGQTADDGKLANGLKIKTEKLNAPESNSDNEDDWQPNYDDDDDKDEVNSEDDNRNKSISKRPKYRAHRIRINGKYKCEFCSKSFFTSSGCSKHEQEKHASIPNQFPCRLCDKAWNSYLYLQKHMLRNHKVRFGARSEIEPPPSSPVKIKIEELNLDNSSDDLDRTGYLEKDDDLDWQQDDGEQSVDEDFEPEATPKKSVKRVRRGSRVRVNGKFKCLYCDKVFSSRSGCQRHEDENHPKIPGQFTCDICGKVWNTKEYLNRHKKEVHPSLANQFPCKFCGRRLNSSSYLKKHVGRMHKDQEDGQALNQRPVIKVDPTMLQKESHLKTLIDLDNIDDDFLNKFKNPAARKQFKFRKRVNGKIKCYYCDKVFPTTRRCHTHEIEYHSSNQFTCEICGKSWKRKECLLRHRKDVHPSIPNQFPCKFCGKGWNSARYLRKHVKRVHENKESIGILIEEKKENPKKKARLRVNGKFKCYYCDKLFARTTGCYRHENEYHPKIPGQYPCEICGKKWNSKVYLSGHKKRAHKVGLAEENKSLAENGDSSSSCGAKDSGDQEAGLSPEPLENGPLDESNQLDVDSGSPFISKSEKVKDELEINHEDGIGNVGECENDDVQLDDVFSAKEEDEDEDEVKKQMEKAVGNVVTTTKNSDKLSYASRNKPFSCKLCDKKFQDRFGLGRHERCHKREERRKKDDELENSSKQKRIRRMRGSRKLEWVDGKVKCETCEKLFKTAATLRNHEKIHKYDELISKMNGQDGESLVPLRRERRKFERVNGKLKCENCDKDFYSLGGLLNHEKKVHWTAFTQTGDIICELCGKGYISVESLGRHKYAVHLLKVDGTTWTPKKPRKVDKEGYGLTRPDGSKRGKNYLLVDGKLKCNSCEKLFISVDGLYKHEKEKHPKKPGEFICTHCGMAFNSLPYLRIHTERKHWLRMDGTPHQPPWVATRKYKWKKSEK